MTDKQISQVHNLSCFYIMFDNLKGSLKSYLKQLNCLEISTRSFKSSSSLGWFPGFLTEAAESFFVVDFCQKSVAYWNREEKFTKSEAT